MRRKMSITTDSDTDRLDRIKKRALRQLELTAKCAFSLDKTSHLDEQKVARRSQFFTSSDRNDTYGQHLLSEGVVVDGVGDPFAIIAKDSIAIWYDKLDPDRTFPIDLAHDDYNPIFKTIGKWSKQDLELVTNVDGRHSLYVKDLHLDEDSLVVKELRRREDILALSVEFYSDIDLVEFEDQPTVLHDNLDIVGFGIVVEPQDALSGGLDLHKHSDSGDTSMKKNKLKALLQDAFGFAEEGKTQMSSVVASNGVNEEPVDEQEKVEAKAEDVKPEASEEKVEAEEPEAKGEDKTEEATEAEAKSENDKADGEDDDDEASEEDIISLVTNLGLKDRFDKQEKFNAMVAESLAKLDSKLDTIRSFNVAAPSDSAKFSNSAVKF